MNELAIECMTCDGTKKIRDNISTSEGYIFRKIKCPECNGLGYLSLNKNRLIDLVEDIDEQKLNGAKNVSIDVKDAEFLSYFALNQLNNEEN